MADKKGQTIIIKRIKKAGHGHHGGAWKVAFADFMTAMMMFFLVMWLLGSDEAIQKSIEEYFKAPQSTQWRKDIDTQRPAVLGDMTAAGESLLNGAQGQVPDNFVKKPERVVNTRADVEQSQAIEAVVSDEAVMSLDTLEFSVPEEQIFADGTMAEWTPQAQKFLPKIGRLTRVYKGKLSVKWDYDNAIQGPDVAGSYEFQNNRAVVLKHHIVDHNYADEDRVTTEVVPQRRPSSVGYSHRRIQFILRKE